ncbi:hypothetical protein ABTN52_19475, partial [Acinetobacter baumannii]
NYTMQMAEGEFGGNSTEAWTPIALLQLSKLGGWVMFSWHALSLLIRLDRRINSRIYLNIVVNEIHLVILMVHPKGD